MTGNMLTHYPVQAGGPFRAARVLRDLLAALRDGLTIYRRYQALSAGGVGVLERSGLGQADLIREAVFPSGR